jgi:hypothetical protein
MERKQYIKPCVMQLDLSVDSEVVSFFSCKTVNDLTASGLSLSCADTPAVGSPCNQVGTS